MTTLKNKLALLFDERCKGLRVLLLAILFGFSTSIFAAPNMNISFADGDDSLVGGSDNDNDDQDKDDDDCDKDDDDACSDKKLNKIDKGTGLPKYITLCKPLNCAEKPFVQDCKKAKDLDKNLGKGYSLPITFYSDEDGDGLGDPNDPNPTVSCLQPEGKVNNNLDCDDTIKSNPEGDQDPCSAANNCGATNDGLYLCDGSTLVCSAGAPADVPGIGDGCQGQSPNATINGGLCLSGTLQCSVDGSSSECVIPDVPYNAPLEAEVCPLDGGEGVDENCVGGVDEGCGCTCRGIEQPEFGVVCAISCTNEDRFYDFVNSCDPEAPPNRLSPNCVWEEGFPR